jgi:predicted NUDIX family NTP pyrophosphohydrolase
MKQSAGILLYKITNSEISVLLAHPGGPFWKNKDLGAWSIPKGEFGEDEEPLAAAIREFREETGMTLSGNFIPLNPVRLKSGKLVHAWALEKDIDATIVKSNLIVIEWPPRSGKKINIPEIDRADWFGVETAREKINPAQADFISQLVDLGAIAGLQK